VVADGHGQRINFRAEFSSLFEAAIQFFST